MSGMVGKRMNEKKTAQNGLYFLIAYTVLFAISAVLAFRYFPAAGKRMVWKGDGLSQHYVALCYYARWGRAVLRSIFAGQPAFPTLNLHMGLGSDLFTTLQYYVIGDPFSLPAVLVPQAYMLDFHDAMILLRMYLAGICFDRYCRAMGRQDLTGNLAGALVYVFSTFALFGMRHPYFLNAMIWFPLLLLGAEHIFRGRKGRLFTLAAFFSCISNFYFFYMLVAMTVVYVVWRALRIHLFPVLQRSRGGAGAGTAAAAPQEAHETEPDAMPAAEAASAAPGEVPAVGTALVRIFRLAVRFLGRAALGTAMGACFLLPILLRFLQDPRASEGTTQGILYALSYYAKLPEAFIGFGTDQTLEYWTCMGFGALGLISVFLLFLNADPGRRPEGRYGRPGEKKGGSHADLKLAFFFLLLLILLPAGGTVLNGFSYPANRWTWALAMLAGYTTAVMLPHLGEISLKKTALLLGLTALYAGICFRLGAAKSTLAELALAGAVILAVRGLSFAVSRTAPGRKAGIPVPVSGQQVPLKGTGKSASLFCSAARGAGRLVPVAAAVLTVAVHAYVEFVPGRENSSLAEYHTDRYIAAMAASDAAGMRSLLGNTPFYRYSGRDLANNFSLLHDVSNTQYYWSLSDGGITQFFAETGQGNGMVHLYDHLDNRTMVDEIAGVKYYKRSDGSLLPFGYEKVEGARYDNRELFAEDEEDPLPVFSFSVYENRYALPLGFTSGAYIRRETYDALSIPQRQEALMQGILLEDAGIGEATAAGGAGGLREADLSFSAIKIPYTARPEEGIRIRERTDGQVEILVQDTGKALYLDPVDPAALSDCESSLLFTGMEYSAAVDEGGERSLSAAEEKELPSDAARAEKGDLENTEDFENTEPVEITITAKRDGDTVSTKKISFTLPDNPWKTGRSDFLSCCGYAQDPPDLLRLKFSRRGTYTFRELGLIGQPMEDYPEQAEALRKTALEDPDLHELPDSGATSRITGRITVPETRILCLQIPHLKGLRGFVDGAEQPLLQADTMFSALVLEPGTHEIELRYRTPGLRAGAWISLAAVLLFLAEAAVDRLRKRQRIR